MRAPRRPAATPSCSRNCSASSGVTRAPRTIDPQAVDRLAPERIAAAVLLRVSRLDPQAPALARAVAVLGEQARLTMCAELAGLAVREASSWWPAGRPRCPRRRGPAAIRPSDRPNGDLQRFVSHRAGRSARACGQVACRAACRPGAIAVHLVATPPSGDRNVVAMLREGRAVGARRRCPDTAAEQPPGAGRATRCQPIVPWCR